MQVQNVAGDKKMDAFKTHINFTDSLFSACNSPIICKQKNGWWLVANALLIVGFAH